MQSVNADLSKFKKAKDWRREDAATLFNTEGSWQWFKRIHRRELIEGHALIVRSGRSGDLVHLDHIGQVVQKIIQSESLKQINTEAAA